MLDTMDYSELVTALKEDNAERVNKLIKAIRPRLLSFLRIHLNASEADAKDISQEALISAIEAIKEDQIEDPDYVVSYILSICKNYYLTERQRDRSTPFDETRIFKKHQPQQLQSILDKEQRRLLNWCLSQLKKGHRQFMDYWFSHPGARAQSIADHFDISVNNVWTRKHRIIKKLTECYQKKNDL